MILHRFRKDQLKYELKRDDVRRKVIALQQNQLDQLITGRPLALIGTARYNLARLKRARWSATRGRGNRTHPDLVQTLRSAGVSSAATAACGLS
jgi:hypothetical protein